MPDRSTIDGQREEGCAGETLGAAASRIEEAVFGRRPFVKIQGRDWGGCPASDKDKWFKCIVREFEAVHDFPGGTKSAGFQRTTSALRST